METNEVMTFLYFSAALLGLNLVLHYKMSRTKVKVPAEIKNIHYKKVS